MATSSFLLKLACLLLVGVVAKAEVTCQQVVSDLAPCITYVSTGGAVPVNCCNGVKTLYSAAQTALDRQNVCKCLKSAVTGISYSDFNLGLAAGLPSKCGMNIPYKISPSTDCDKY